MNKINLNKHALARYIIVRHLEWKDHSISPLKLQKSLFFLYFIYKEHDHELFQEDFVLGKYGPKDDSVLFRYRNNMYKHRISDLLKDDVFLSVQEDIDFLLKELFDISDFTLVDFALAVPFEYKKIDESLLSCQEFLDRHQDLKSKRKEFHQVYGRTV